MKRKDSQSVLIKKGETLHRFISCKLEPTDGSFYITFLRDGANNESYTFDSETNTTIVKHNQPRKKLVRISYHSSGCVLYRYTDISSNYFEPIARITKTNWIAGWSVPSVDKLDEATIIHNEDYIIEPSFLSKSDGRVAFSFLIAPFQQQIDVEHFAIGYEGFFKLIVIPFIPDELVPEGMEKHFITYAPKMGLYNEQAIGTDQALIEYHQKLQKSKDLIIYAPNKEGIYTLITAVPMRASPDINVRFADEQYYVELISSKNNVVKFKVKNKHDHVEKNEVEIISIFLSAEL